jgi:flavin reductase (DIM6/NTAB) family NADH-FMN oxidoreductase RutF
MIYTKKDIKELDRITRLKLINSVTGIKPANLIGTIRNNMQTNLAIFSSVVHLGSNPGLLGFISRPQTKEVGHTLRNIEENGSYTINHIHPDFVKNAHYTSAKFANEDSEFKHCNLSEEYHNGIIAPFVKESAFKMGMRFIEALEIKHNGTVMVIGEIEHLIIPDTGMIHEDIDLEATKSIGISGLNSYYSLQKIARYPYAKVNEVPLF